MWWVVAMVVVACGGVPITNQVVSFCLSSFEYSSTADSTWFIVLVTIVAFNSSISFVKVVALVYISDPLAGKQQCNVYMPFSSNQPIGQGSYKNV